MVEQSLFNFNAGISNIVQNQHLFEPIVYAHYRLWHSFRGAQLHYTQRLETNIFCEKCGESFEFARIFGRCVDNRFEQDGKHPNVQTVLKPISNSFQVHPILHIKSITTPSSLRKSGRKVITFMRVQRSLIMKIHYMTLGNQLKGLEFQFQSQEHKLEVPWKCF